MIAVFKSGGKQYCVKTGQVLKVEKIDAKKGDNFTFNEILLLSNKSQNTIGNPLGSHSPIHNHRMYKTPIWNNY